MYTVKIKIITLTLLSFHILYSTSDNKFYEYSILDSHTNNNLNTNAIKNNNNLKNNTFLNLNVKNNTDFSIMTLAHKEFEFFMEEKEKLLSEEKKKYDKECEQLKKNIHNNSLDDSNKKKIRQKLESLTESYNSKKNNINMNIQKARAKLDKLSKIFNSLRGVLSYSDLIGQLLLKDMIEKQLYDNYNISIAFNLWNQKETIEFIKKDLSDDQIELIKDILILYINNIIELYTEKFNDEFTAYALENDEKLDKFYTLLHNLKKTIEKNNNHKNNNNYFETILLRKYSDFLEKSNLHRIIAHTKNKNLTLRALLEKHFEHFLINEIELLQKNTDTP